MDSNKNDVMLDISIPEQSNGSLVGVYLKLVFIPIVFFLVFLLGFFHVINLKVEVHSIVMMAFLLIIALIVARHNAEYGCRLFEERIGAFKKSLKDYIMSHLFIIGNRKKSNASFDDFADDFSHDIRNENYSSVAAGVFPMLGILGTFISIAISMPSFSSKNINMLEGEISQLLGGVGTAFYVSIFGIFLALWWIYFEKRGLSRYQKLIFKYKNATKNFFWQQDEITQGLIQELCEQSNKQSEILNKNLNFEFLQNFSKILDDKFERFEDVVKLEEKSLNTVNSQIKIVNDVSNDISALQTDLINNYKDLSTTIEKLVANLYIIEQNISKETNNLADFGLKINGLFSDNSKFIHTELSNFKNEFNEAKNNLKNIFNDVSDEFKSGISSGIEEFKKEFKDQTISNLDNKDLIEELKESLANIDNQKNG